MTIIPLAPPSLAGSSDRPGGLRRAVFVPTGALRAAGTPPYLVLLRAGFCLPLVLPRARCALTAPFHPYPPRLSRASAGGMFSVPLSFELPRPGVTRRTALRSSDFPPAFAPCGAPAGDRLARCDEQLYTWPNVHLAISSIGFLGDLILLQLLVQIAAWRVDRLRRLRDVPAVLAQLLDEIRALGVVLELAQRSAAAS